MPSTVLALELARALETVFRHEDERHIKVAAAIAKAYREDTDA